MADAATTPAPKWPSDNFRLFLVHDINAPWSLVGSVKEAHTDSFEERFATVVVTCASPCPSSGFPEQTITHALGSSWAGDYTVSGTTTSRGCRLGQGTGDVITDQLGMCSEATAGPGETINHNVSATPVNECWVDARSKMVFVTAGLDDWFKVEPTYTLDAETIRRDLSSALSKRGCATSTAPKTTATGAATDKASSAASATITDPSAAQSPGYSGAATTSTSGKSGAACAGRSLTILFGVSALATLVSICS